MEKAHGTDPSWDWAHNRGLMTLLVTSSTCGTYSRQLRDLSLYSGLVRTLEGEYSHFTAGETEVQKEK